jgi:hypothetical protein
MLCGSRGFSAPTTVRRRPQGGLNLRSLRSAEPVSKMGSDEAFIATTEAKEEDRKIRLSDRSGFQQQSKFKFGQRRGEHVFERGLTSEARRVAAEAEEGYRLTSDSLNQRPGGLTGGEEVRRIDPNTGEDVVYRRYAAPFGETLVPSFHARFAVRGQVGQLANTTHSDSWELPESRALSNSSLLAERRIQHVLDAPELPLLEKVELLGTAVGEVFSKQLPLQPKIWTALFTVWGQAHAAPLVDAYSQKQSRLARPTMSSLPSSKDSATTTGFVTSSPGSLLMSTQSLKCLDWMKESYFHMRSGFTAPTAQIMEAMMGALALSGATDQPTVHLAHRILLDADRFVTLPTRTTYAAYFDICNRCELMHFAVKRFADAIDKLYIEPDAAMATALLRGLHENGLVEEAVAMLARMERIDADVQFLNASMETLLLSNDARAVLASYDAVITSNSTIMPSSETFTLMLLACERLADWSPVRRILSEMQHHKVKGDAQCLNLLLKGLLLEKMNTFAHQLYLTMRLKKIDVWPAVEAALPTTIKSAVVTLSRKRLKRLTKDRQQLRGNEPMALTKHVVGQAQLLRESLHVKASPPAAQVHDDGLRQSTPAHRETPQDARPSKAPVTIDLDELLADHYKHSGSATADRGVVLPQQRRGWVARRAPQTTPRSQLN